MTWSQKSFDTYPMRSRRFGSRVLAWGAAVHENLLATLGIDRIELCHFHLPGRDKGHIAELRSAMADAGVNIQVVYLATKNRAVAVTSDNAKARQALGM